MRNKSTCYKTTGSRHFDVGGITAEVVDFVIERTTTIHESKRQYFSKIRLHSIVKSPDEMNGALLETRIVKDPDPSHVEHIDDNHIGVGIFSFYEPVIAEQYLSVPNGFFSLAVAFSDNEFELIVNMLQQDQTNSLCKFILKADVVGIQPECEWNKIGSLCATEVTISCSVRNPNEF